MFLTPAVTAYKDEKLIALGNYTVSKGPAEQWIEIIVHNDVCLSIHFKYNITNMRMSILLLLFNLCLTFYAVLGYSLFFTIFAVKLIE